MRARARLRLGQYDEARNDTLRAQTISALDTGFARQSHGAYLELWLGEADFGQGDLAGCAIRVSGGWATTQADWNTFVEAWLSARQAASRRKPAVVGA